LKVLYLSLLVVITDQLTKFLVKGIKIPWLGINFPGMPYGASKPFLGKIVKITFIENPGMAFGLDVGPKMFLTIFTILASIIILYYIFKHRKDGKLIRISLAFILAGAVGNLIDRTFYGMLFNYAPVFYGRVVDFVQIDFWNFTIFGRTYTSWPIFNIADVSVTIGFLIILIFHKRVFHHEETVEVVAAGENQDSVIPVDGDNPGNNINSLPPNKIENSAQNKNDNPSGSAETPD
jgi:signal peptidase II